MSECENCRQLEVSRDALHAENTRLAAKLDDWLNGPPAQMSYNGRLVPINSTGMREVIDEAGRLASLNATAVEALEQAVGYLQDEQRDRVAALLVRLRGLSPTEEPREAGDEGIDYTERGGVSPTGEHHLDNPTS